jgi:hypothetical protein
MRKQPTSKSSRECVDEILEITFHVREKKIETQTAEEIYNYGYRQPQE